MIGTILLILLGVILVALLAALLLPVSVHLNYENGTLRIDASCARKRIAVYPGANTGKTKKTKSSKKKTSTDAEKKPKVKPNWEQIRYSLDVLPGVLIQALSRTARRICITPLKVHLLVAGSDPADTAVLYGKLQGVLAVALPALHRAVRIKDQDIQLFPDFSQERMDCIADLGVRLRILDVVIVAVGVVGGLIKWRTGFGICCNHWVTSYFCRVRRIKFLSLFRIVS